jgi:hypothetical protein
MIRFHRVFVRHRLSTFHYEWDNLMRRGEAILQVRAAWQSEDESLANHLRNRPTHVYSKPPKSKSIAA